MHVVKHCPGAGLVAATVCSSWRGGTAPTGLGEDGSQAVTAHARSVAAIRRLIVTLGAGASDSVPGTGPTRWTPPILEPLGQFAVSRSESRGILV